MPIAPDVRSGKKIRIIDPGLANFYGRQFQLTLNFQWGAVDINPGGD